MAKTCELNRTGNKFSFSDKLEIPRENWHRWKTKDESPLAISHGLSLASFPCFPWICFSAPVLIYLVTLYRNWSSPSGSARPGFPGQTWMTPRDLGGHDPKGCEELGQDKPYRREIFSFTKSTCRKPGGKSSGSEVVVVGPAHLCLCRVHYGGHVLLFSTFKQRNESMWGELANYKGTIWD